MGIDELERLALATNDARTQYELGMMLEKMRRLLLLAGATEPRLGGCLQSNSDSEDSYQHTDVEGTFNQQLSPRLLEMLELFIA